jgi:ElaB/YqjD/DUF883 family membrane-anchored ribosome-binding protein
MGPEQSLMTNEELHDKEPRSSTEIESDIRQTRGRMDTTLDELGDRLTARSLLNSALDWWESRGVGARTGGATKDTYQSVARYVKENPIPALLVGTGVAWMIIEATTSDEEETRVYTERASDKGKRSDSATRYYPSEYQGEDQTETGGGESGPGFAESAKDKLEQAKEAVAEVAGAAKEKVSALGDAATEAAEDVGRRAQEVYDEGRSTARKIGRSIESGYHSSAEQLENAMEEYPLAVGIGFAALGALVGVLLPRTRREDELLGEQSDQLLKVTKEKGQELLERGKVVAQRVSESVLDEARQQGLTPEAASETMSELAGKVGEVARKAKEEAGTAAKDEKLSFEHLKQEASSAAAGIKQDREASAQKKSDEHG